VQKKLPPVNPTSFFNGRTERTNTDIKTMLFVHEERLEMMGIEKQKGILEFLQ